MGRQSYPSLTSIARNKCTAPRVPLQNRDPVQPSPPEPPHLRLGSWSKPQSGRHYRSGRWRSLRREQRDPELLRALLAKHSGVGSVLDVPCGSGRLRGVLQAASPRYVGVDYSEAMLQASRAAGSDPAPVDRSAWIRADIAALPFGDRSFDAVVVCRLLHHFGSTAQLEAALRECARVARKLVIASFWDRSSIPAQRKLLRCKLGLANSDTRVARSRDQIQNALSAANLRAIEFQARPRFLSQQTFFVAEHSSSNP